MRGRICKKSQPNMILNQISFEKKNQSNTHHCNTRLQHTSEWDLKKKSFNTHNHTENHSEKESWNIQQVVWHTQSVILIHIITRKIFQVKESSNTQQVVWHTWKSFQTHHSSENHIEKESSNAQQLVWHTSEVVSKTPFFAKSYGKRVI